MNREEFMRQLEQMLGGISESERSEALSFYQDYFDDAGPENEGAVIRELGSPGKVAAIIKADLNSSSRDYGQFTEHGFVDDRIKEGENMPQPSEEKKQEDEGEKQGFGQKEYWQNRWEQAKQSFQGQRKEDGGPYGGTQDTYGSQAGSGYGGGQTYGGENSYGGSNSDNAYGPYSQTGNTYGGSYGSYTGSSRPRRRYRDPRRRSGGNLLLIIIVIIVLSPLILGLGAGAVGVIFGAIGGILGLALGIIAAVFGCLVGGIASIVWGVIKCFVSPGVGILAIGTGSLAIALGILGLILLVWLFGKVLPWLVRKLVALCSKLLHNGRGGAKA